MKKMTDDPLANAGTNVVISRGNPNAKLLIVGEAPGPEENVQGKPFVGRAGQLLDKILCAATFDPEKDVYITNSVFRLPPGEDGKTGITTLRGKWAELNGCWIMPIYHPSYLLRNPSREPGSPKAQMWDDIREVRRKYNELLASCG
jgi:uracil-DNA glycosylase